MESERYRAGLRLALFGCILAFGVIGLGAFTRLVDAGLGCPDWPGCYGHALWPRAAEDVARANAAFPDTPVEHDKTWPEMIHRYFAASLGVLAIGLALLSWRHRRQSDQPVKLPFLLLGLIILQGVFGMWTVTLKLWPKVVTVHLLGGFATLTLFWLLTQRLANWRWQLPMASLGRLYSLRPWVVLALLVTIGQITLGGWVTANYAAVACPDLPTCQGQWLPPMDFKHGFNVFQELGPNYLGGQLHNEARVAIHYAHRVGALVTVVVVGTLCSLLWWRGALPVTRRMAVLLGAVLGLQVLLGLGNILLHFPVWVAVAHNVVGALLLLILVTLTHRVYTAMPQADSC